MNRYGYRTNIDPRASVYRDEDMDFSRGSFSTRPRAVAFKEPSETSRPSSPPHHAQFPRPVPPPSPPSSASLVSKNIRQAFQEVEKESYNGNDQAITPPQVTAPVSAYVAWTGGVQYSNPENAIVEPISTEELLEGLSDMRLQREKRNAELGTGPRGPPGSGFNPDDGYRNRVGDIGRPADQGYGNRAVQSIGGNDDPWGGGGGDDDNWGNRSGGGGGGGGGAQKRGDECYNCGELGHRAAGCTQERKPRGGGGGPCFKCGEEGHISRECVNAASSGGRGCFNCGQPGHESRECQNDRVVGAFRGACFNCNEQGHASRDCPNERKAGMFRGTCHNCREEGHQSRDCLQPRNLGSRYDDRDTGRGPAEFANQGDVWGAPLDTPKTPGFIRSSGDDGGWGEEQIVTPTAPTVNRGRSMDRQADEWGTPAPALIPINKAPQYQTRGNDDGWSRPGPHVAEAHSVKQVPTPIPAGPGPGIHPDRLRMLNQQGVAIGGYVSRQEPSRDRATHMDRGGDGFGGDGGEGGRFSGRSPSVPFSAAPQQMRQAPPVPQQPMANDGFDGW